MPSHDRHTILLVEDETDLRELIGESLESSGFEVTQSGTAADARDRLRAFPFDALVMDLHLPDDDGMTVLESALETYPQLVAVVITGYGTVSAAVHAIKRGAKDFLIKPFELSKLAHILTVNLEHRELRQENAELKAQLQDRFRVGGLIGTSEAMQALCETLKLIAPTPTTVLLEGETGTGKELVARTIHHNSPRRDQRFVAFNAAAIPESLAEAVAGHQLDPHNLPDPRSLAAFVLRARMLCRSAGLSDGAEPVQRADPEPAWSQPPLDGALRTAGGIAGVIERVDAFLDHTLNS